MNEKTRIGIDVLLNEYQACHRTRDAYARIRWSVGSIFIATSLGLVGLSYNYKEYYEIVGMLIVSIVSLIIWFLYNRNITVYTLKSIYRMHEIEIELRRMKFNIRLHKSIHKTPKTRGLWITMLFYGIVFVAWNIRLLVYNHLNVWKWDFAIISSSIIYLILALILVYVKYTSLNVNKKIDALLEEEEKREQTLSQFIH